MEVKFFKTPAELRKWFEKNHDKATEQWVGFYKKGSGKPSITWPESVDQALCFGWIDGLRKSIDEESYKIRFTPRKAKSIWSAVNIKRASELKGLGLMHANGLSAFEKRDEKLAQRYAYEQESVSLDPAYEKQLRKNKKAWEFFQSQPPSYRKVVSWWIVRAKQEETRLRRLETLITDSAAGRRIGAVLRPAKK
jgi:uncharacterized protein YdeI (YjbR/CyaY-like superfamily)